MKRCTKCNVFKSVDQFSKRLLSKDGLNHWCKLCVRSNNTKYRKENIVYVRLKQNEYQRAHPEKQQNKELKHKFGITKEIYDRLFEKQSGVCAICGQRETAKNRWGKVFKLSVDHDHRTKKVRGLLCTRCNKGIGMFDEDILNLLNAINYLGGNIA